MLSKSIIKVDTGDIDLYDEQQQADTEMATNDMTEVSFNFFFFFFFFFFNNKIFYY